MTSSTVPTGPYKGWTYQELTGELQRFKDRRQQISRLIGSTVNGNSFTRESSAVEMRSLNAQMCELEDAMHYLRPDLNMPAPSRSTAVEF